MPLRLVSYLSQYTMKYVMYCYSISGIKQLQQTSIRQFLKVNILNKRQIIVRGSQPICLLRRGVYDLVTSSSLMGHSSTAVIQRYLYLVDDDLLTENQRARPVDNDGLS